MPACWPEASCDRFGQIAFQIYWSDEQVSKIQHLNQHQQNYFEMQIRSAFVAIKKMHVKKAFALF